MHAGDMLPLTPPGSDLLMPDLPESSQVVYPQHAVAVLTLVCPMQQCPCLHCCHRGKILAACSQSMGSAMGDSGSDACVHLCRMLSGSSFCPALL